MSVLGVGFPSVVRPSRPAAGYGNPNTNGLMGLLGQEYTDLKTGQVWMKGGPLREVGWFPIGAATGNAMVIYGTSNQAAPIGVVASAGPVVWYGTNGSIWVKTDPGNDTLNWYSLINPVSFLGGFGAGSVDPYFGFAQYQMNNPTRTSGVTHLTWTVPVFPTQACRFQNILGQITVFFNTINTLDITKSRVVASLANLVVPTGVFVWGVTGLASSYTSAQLSQLISSTTADATQTILGAVLGNGHAVNFIQTP